MKASDRFMTYGEAQTFCRENGFDEIYHLDPWALADRIIALKEKQDKITRHACADNIMKHPDEHPYAPYKVIEKDTAHRIIMNTRSV